MVAHADLSEPPEHLGGSLKEYDDAYVKQKNLNHI